MSIKLNKYTNEFLIQAALKQSQMSVDLIDYVSEAIYSGSFKKENIHFKADLSNILESLSFASPDELTIERREQMGTEGICKFGDLIKSKDGVKCFQLKKGEEENSVKLEVFTVLRNELTLKVEECLSVLELRKVRDFSLQEIFEHKMMVKDQQMAKILTQMEEFKKESEIKSLKID